MSEFILKKSIIKNKISNAYVSTVRSAINNSLLEAEYGTKTK